MQDVILVRILVMFELHCWHNGYLQSILICEFFVQSHLHSPWNFFTYIKQYSDCIWACNVTNKFLQFICVFTIKSPTITLIQANDLEFMTYIDVLPTTLSHKVPWCNLGLLQAFKAYQNLVSLLMSTSMIFLFCWFSLLWCNL